MHPKPVNPNVTSLAALAYALVTGLALRSRAQRSLQQSMCTLCPKRPSHCRCSERRLGHVGTL